MDWDLAHLRALDATVREGTLEAAARVLHVTPSAVSQRLRALEVSTGRVLLVRTKPVQVTESGQVVLRLARQVDLLGADVRRELGGTSDERLPSVPIAVNADSMATWVLPALAPLAGEVCFDLHREDQEHTSDLLRAGTVLAAVTADSEPVPGCSSTRLGAMRYRPLASPDFARRWFPNGPGEEDALSRAPVVVFDRKDDLQQGYLSVRIGPDVTPPVHYVPASAAYVSAVALGLGWGMVPDLQRPDVPDLVEFDPTGAVDVMLYWQQWRMRSATLDRLRETLVAAAERALDQPT